MAPAVAGERTLKETPTWALALVCAVFVILSILIEHGIESLAKVQFCCFNLFSLLTKPKRNFNLHLCNYCFDMYVYNSIQTITLIYRILCLFIIFHIEITYKKSIIFIFYLLFIYFSRFSA